MPQIPLEADKQKTQHQSPTFRSAVHLSEFNSKVTQGYRHHNQYGQKITEECHLDNNII